MPLAVNPNPVLDRPSPRLLIDLHLADTFPYSLPLTFGGTPTLLATSDCDPPSPLAGHYIGRIVGEFNMQLGNPTEFGGVQRVEQIQFTLGNHDGLFNSFFTQEVRGKIVVAHLYDVNAAEVQQNVFVGQVTAFSSALHLLTVTATSTDLGSAADVIPRQLVTTTDFPSCDPSGGSLGLPLATGWGVGMKVPGRYVRARLQATDPDYFDYVWSGNVGIDRVWQGGRPLLTNQDPEGNPYYTILPSTYYVKGKACTAIRFRRRQSDVPGGTLIPVLADIQRYPDVDPRTLFDAKWNRGFFDDANGNNPAQGAGSAAMTTSALVAGPTGVNLGAVKFDGATQWLDVPNPGFLAISTLTFSVWVYPESTAASGEQIVMMGPMSFNNSGGTGMGWWIGWDAATQLCHIHSRHAGAGSPINTTAAQTAPLRTWTLVSVVIGLSFNLIQINANAGTFGFSTGLPLYAASGNMRFGADNAGANAFQGRVGYAMQSVNSRSARELARSYYILRRNPAEFAREVVEFQMRGVPDDTTFTAAAATLDTIDDGLKCDGWITELVAAGDVLSALAPFRDMKFTRGTNGNVLCNVGAAVTTADLQLGLNDGQFNNIEVIDSRVKASLAEAVASLPVAYRQLRDDNGILQGYQVPGQLFPVSSVGITVAPLELPFVYDDTTGDIVGAFRAAGFQLRDELLTIEAGHEVRKLIPGKVARITVPAEGIGPADYEVLMVDKRLHQHQVALCPYSSARFTYFKANFREQVRKYHARLVGYWRFDDAGSTSVALPDAVAASQVQGAYQGGYLLGQRDLLYMDPSTGVLLDGLTGFVEIPNDPLFNPRSGIGLSLSFVVQDFGTSGATAHNFLRKRTGTGAGYTVEWDLTNVTARFSDGTTTLSATVAFALADGHPHRIGVSMTTAAVKLYIDGVLQNTAAGAVTIVANTTTVRLGADDTASAASLFKGAVKDLAIYDTVLADQDFADLNTAGSTAPRIFPPSTSPDTTGQLDPGAVATLLCNGASGAATVTAPAIATFTLQLLAKETLVPIANGDLGFETLVGALSRWQALLTNDGDTSYVDTATRPSAPADDVFQWVRVSAPATSRGRIFEIEPWAYVKVPSASTATFRVWAKINGNVYLGNIFTTSTTSYTQEIGLILGINTTLKVTIADLLGMQVGVSQSAASFPGTAIGIRVTQMGCDVLTILDAPSNFGYAKLIKVATGAAAPTELSAYTQLAPALTFVERPANGTYDYYVRLYDSLGRFIRQVGPNTVTFN